MIANKSKKPMTGAQRFAKYVAKMTETNQSEWCSKMKEKRVHYLARMSEQKRDELRKKDKERKKAKRAADKIEKSKEVAEVYKTKAALSKAQAKALRALPSRPCIFPLQVSCRGCWPERRS